MPFLVEDGSGLPTATSLVSVADADTILEMRLHTEAWTGADQATKEAGLSWASRILTRLNWRGFRVKTDQALCWPRSWVPKWDSVMLQGGGYLPFGIDYYPEDAVPFFVQEATAVGAMRLIERDPLARPLTTGIQQQVVGPLSITYDTARVEDDRNDPLDDEVLQIIDFALDRGAIFGRGAKPAVRV